MFHRSLPHRITPWVPRAIVRSGTSRPCPIRRAGNLCFELTVLCEADTRRLCHSEGHRTPDLLDAKEYTTSSRSSAFSQPSEDHQVLTLNSDSRKSTVVALGASSAMTTKLTTIAGEQRSSAADFSGLRYSDP